jgi:hypothetical protein
MEIQIQYIDGDISRFTMTDEPRGVEIIESIKPSEFFNQPLLRIQSGKRTTIFSMNAVESIYFSTSLKATIREQPPATTFRTISETEYLEKLQILRSQYESTENLFERGHSIDTLLALHCVSGKKHFVQAEIIAGHRVEQLKDLHNRLGQLTTVIPCSPEGYMAINPRNIKRIEMYPAPPESTHTAWLVD